MNYNHVIPAVFLRRPNRFIAQVEIDGREETVHVKNTGRCRELLRKGARVYLAVAENPNRKTKYDLIAVEKKREGKPDLLINMDSQIVNDVAEEWLRKGVLFSPQAEIRREVRFGNSRFDFFIRDGERTAFLEVKGVTLELDGIAAFPDAPTLRGVKHLRELEACRSEEHEAYVLFVVQMKEIRAVIPNDGTHKEFGDALRHGVKSGVQVLAVDCAVTPNTITAQDEVEVLLNEGSL